DYILFAYKMTPGSAKAMEKQVPGWVMTERYDITAKTDKDNATKDEMRLMMRSLLADRFKLIVRSETNHVPVYGLTLAKPGTLGPKLRAHVASEPCEPLGEKEKPTDTVAGGFPKVCGAIVQLPNRTPGMTTMAARDVPIAQLVGVLSGFGNLGRPVLDQTGLTGTYDFLMEYAPERSPPQGDAANAPPDFAGPGLEQALKQQLGLKLESKKSEVDVWVVDHVEHATQN
ncbi:MAG: TIGR03435 family protein, partial [Acidobacteriota bacterium]|nr:TIGR03435 family protein [Acidobacteriota bacterium]